MSADAIRKQLKSGELAKLCLLYGDEDFLKDSFAAAIEKKAVDAMESFNLQRFSDETFNLSQLAAALDNLPVMSRRKCIHLRDIDPDKLKADDWKEFLRLLKSIPDECVLLLSYSSVRFDKKSSRWKTLIANAQKEGVCAEIGRMDTGELASWLCRQATACGSRLAESTALYIIDRVGNDMTLLNQEVKKLSAYAGDGEITKQAVDELAVRPLDSSIYDLAKAVVAGRTGRALELLGELFQQREEPVVILSALSGSLCDLYRAKAALQSGAGQAQIEADFGYRGREFRIRNALRDCRQLDAAALRRSLDLLMRADEALKSTRVDNKVILERLIIEMAAAKTGRAPR